MDVTLVMFTQNGERRDFIVKGGKATIGRTKGCGIQIALEVVSRRHCEIQVKDEKVLMRDLGSSNGTYVNKKRVQQTELKAGDTVIVGPVVFTVVVDGQPAQVKAIRTVVGGRKKKGSRAKKSHETGSVDLDGSSQMNLVVGDLKDESSGTPLVEMDELLETKGKGGD